MSRHRLPLPPEALQILAEHRRAFLRWRCRLCGQSWRCLARAWADDMRCDIRRGRRPRVTSLPVGHGTDVVASSEVSDAMAVRTQGQAADAAAQVSGVRSESRLLPHHEHIEAAHPV